MIKVGITDDHTLFRRSLRALIHTFENIEVVLEAENGDDLLQKLEITIPDILLLDLSMPILDGFDTCKVVADKFPSIKILIISQIISKESILKCMQNGAHGYFSKNADPAHLETALLTIHEAGFYFEPGISSILNELILDEKKSRMNNVLSELTEREMNLVKLVCRGYNNEEIGNAMSINIRTVESYRRRILEKTDLRNFTSVVLTAIKFKYVSIDALLTKNT